MRFNDLVQQVLEAKFPTIHRPPMGGPVGDDETEPDIAALAGALARKYHLRGIPATGQNSNASIVYVGTVNGEDVEIAVFGGYGHSDPGFLTVKVGDSHSASGGYEGKDRVRQNISGGIGTAIPGHQLVGMKWRTNVPGGNAVGEFIKTDDIVDYLLKH